MSVTSQNGKTYAILDFEQVNAKGLKPLTDAIARAGTPIVSVDGSNRATRKDGVQVKSAVITLQDGQTLAIQVNDTGDLSGVKLNGKTLPFQHSASVSTVGGALGKSAADNSKRFTDSLAKKAIRVAKTSSTAPAVKSNFTRLKEANSRKEAAQASVKTITASVKQLQNSANTLTTQLQHEQTRLAQAQAVGVQLQKQIDALGANQ